MMDDKQSAFPPPLRVERCAQHTSFFSVCTGHPQTFRCPEPSPLDPLTPPNPSPRPHLSHCRDRHRPDELRLALHAAGDHVFLRPGAPLHGQRAFTPKLFPLPKSPSPRASGCHLPSPLPLASSPLASSRVPVHAYPRVDAAHSTHRSFSLVTAPRV